MKSWQKVRWTVYLLMAVLSLLPLATGAGAQEPGSVVVLTFKGVVTPVLQNYLERGIARAEAIGAEALVLELDTPGGNVNTMLEIVQDISASPVPVIVYVAPRGAHASSAGTLITLAGHLAGMAPGTTIGAASPVGSGGEDLPETLKAKQVNTLVKDAQNLARRRGEKAVEWAGKAVSEAAAATADEALALGVIDAIAPTLPDLLRQLDGKEVEVMGQTRRLDLADAPLTPLPLNSIESLLNVIVNPSIAAILLTIGAQALLIELSSPGGYIAGIVGIACLLLAFYALGALEANWIGLGFIALAFVLFFLDIKSPTHGLLLVLGLISFVAGAAILFNTPTTNVPWPTITGLALATAGFFTFAVAKALQVHRRPATTGSEGLIGAVGTARTDLNPAGSVLVQGELWAAEAQAGPIKAGEHVQVVGRESFRLKVKRAEQ